MGACARPPAPTAPSVASVPGARGSWLWLTPDDFNSIDQGCLYSSFEDNAELAVACDLHGSHATDLMPEPL